MDRRRSDVMFAVALTALAAWFVGAEVLRRGEPLGLDQGLFACFTRWVPRGWLPYRDLFDAKPPLFLYSYVLARLFPGEITQQIWGLEGVWLVATMTAAFFVAARLAGRWAGVTAAALMLAGEWAPGWGGYWARAQADEFLALPLLGAALLSWKSDARSAFWVGVLTGVAGLFKLPSLAAAAAWPLVWRFDLRRCIWMICGLLVPWVLAAAWFGGHGAFGDFFQAVFVYPRHNAAYIAPPLGSVLRDFAVQLGTHAPLLLFLALFGVLRERRRLLPWVLLTLLAVIAQRQLAGYQFLLAMPALAVAGGVGAVELARKKWAWGVVALLTALLGWQWWQAYGGSPSYERGVFSPALEADVTSYISTRTRSSDGILIWGMAPGVYALSDRHPVTRYPFHKILMTEAPLSRMIPGLEARRAELLARMEKDPPVYVLVGRRDRNGFESEDSFASLRRWNELYSLLQRDYLQETEIGRFIVLRRR